MQQIIEPNFIWDHIYIVVKDMLQSFPDSNTAFVRPSIIKRRQNNLEMLPGIAQITASAVSTASNMFIEL